MTAPVVTVIDGATVLVNLGAGVDWAHPGAIGATTPNSGAFTTVSASSTASVSAGALQWSLGSRSAVTTFPAAYLAPAAANVCAFDIMPNGAPSESVGNGFAWLDICDTDIRSGSPAVQCLRIGALGTYVELGTRAFNGGTVKPLYITLDGTKKIEIKTDGTVLLAAATTCSAGISATTLTSSALTSGRVPTITTAGLLTDSAKLTYVPDVLKVGDGTGGSGAALQIDAAVNTRKGVQFQTAGVLRWQFTSGTAAEAGADSGCPFEILARTDAGAAIDTPFSIVRAAGGQLATTRPFKFATAAVASLPAASTAGRVYFATDGRKNGEGAGVGTGVLVFDDGTAWRAVDTGATVAA